MPEEPRRRADPARSGFVLEDRHVVLLAAATALGAWRAGGPPLPVGLATLALGLLARRPLVLASGLACLAATLADRALAGLDPVAAGPFEGWVQLIGDPAPLDGGGVRVDVAAGGRRVEATAFGAAAADLEHRLAGERLLVAGRLRPPPEDAPWLLARRVVGGLGVEEVRSVAPGSAATRAANALRRTFADGAAHLPTRSRSLLAGVVLGDDREQPPEVVDDFRAAGLGHLVVVSGQNVVFVLLAAGPLLRSFRWRSRLPLTLLVLGAFALVVRFEPSVLRAVAMAAVATLAAAAGRPAAGGRVLALAVTGLVLVDPLLVRSVGFLLSASASASILAVAPRLQVALGGPRRLAEPLAVTLAAQVGTAPLLLLTFGPLPVASIPANLLAVPAAGALMVWGLVAGLLAGVAPAPVAAALHLPSQALTGWLAEVADRAAGLPLGTIDATRAAVLVGVVALGGALRRLDAARARGRPDDAGVGGRLEDDAGAGGRLDDAGARGRSDDIGAGGRLEDAGARGRPGDAGAGGRLGGAGARGRPADAGAGGRLDAGGAPGGRRWRAGAQPVVVAACAVVLLAASLDRPTPGHAPRVVADVGTLEVVSGRRVLRLDGRAGAERALEALRLAGARCVDVVAVERASPGGVALAAALGRRCDGLVVVAEQGVARPGWLAVPPGEPLLPP